ncbi:hypothetical protein [Microbacterium sp. PRC9]|uniref:hypothetical protein n=1 Tax=Microbacterium sp. PRC9 TaxID=2962591 RepID=UPI002882B0B3|nr:hypothetical protein [Microbacterium sp. PRC9]MDT0144515.1 hypothetical protein [Microbacterium sp. PRC9]
MRSRSLLPASAVVTAAILIGPPLTVHADTTPSPTPSPSEASVTWAIGPAAVEGSDDRVSLRYELDPGANATDAVTVTNFSDTDEVFHIYASDGVLSEDGNFDLLPAGTEPADGGSWVTLTAVDGASASPDGGLILAMAPASTATIPVEISVPDNAAPGDHPAGIVAELIPGSTSDVQFASRVGVRIHLRVTGEVAVQAVPAVAEESWTPSWNPFAPGIVTVTYTTTNTGNVRVGTASDVAITGPFGVAGASRSDAQREILPSGSSTTTTELEVWPLFLALGTITTTPSVVGDDDIDAGLSPASTSFTVWTIPWSQLVLIALVVGGFFLVRILRARAAARTQARIDEAVARARATDAPASDPDSDLSIPESEQHHDEVTR